MHGQQPHSCLPALVLQEMGDEHDDPNVDCQYVAFRGVAVQLPPGVQLVN